MKIICLTGMPGSGKSVVANVARSMGIPVLVMGDVVRDEAKKRGIELTPDNLTRLALQLRKEHGVLSYPYSLLFLLCPFLFSFI